MATMILGRRTCVRLLAGVAALGLMHAGALAQSRAAKPEFDVASVKLAEQLDPGKMMAAYQSGHMPKMGAHIEGLRAEYSQMTLLQLIANAYDVKPYQVSGPDWMKDVINGQRFDIVANMPEGSTKDDAPKMLRTLLEQRFKLEATKTAAEKPIYALVEAKGGPKLKESAEKPKPLDPNAPLGPGEVKMDGPDGPMIIKRNPDGSSEVNMGEKGKLKQRVDMQSRTIHIEGSSVTMPGLADMMTQITMSPVMSQSGGREIQDQTGLKGYYEIAFDLSIAELMRMQGGGQGGAPATEASDPSGGMTIEDSIGKMGLKLEPGKGSVEQVAVSHVEKMPTEN